MGWGGVGWGGVGWGGVGWDVLELITGHQLVIFWLGITFSCVRKFAEFCVFPPDRPTRQAL